MEELVLCVRDYTQVLPVEFYTHRLFEMPSFFVPKRIAEEDATFRQVIPYTVISKRAVEGPARLFAYQRAGNEARLHGKWSIGLGGHVNLSDAAPRGAPLDTGVDARAAATQAAVRELIEEVAILFEGLEVSLQPEFVATVCVSLSLIDRTHVGVVGLLECPPQAQLQLRRPAQSAWLTLEELRSLSLLETWSQLLVDTLDDAKIKDGEDGKYSSV